MLLEQSRMSSSQETSPVTYRGSSEPPDNNISNFNDTSGLRRSRQPIKVAGITMGSTENLNVDDELASVFANRRRRRRSATPVKIGGIVMGDENETDQDNELPFGLDQKSKRNSYHPGMNGTNNKRHSSIGIWGQRKFTSNGQSNFNNSNTDSSSTSTSSTLERPPKKDPPKQNLLPPLPPASNDYKPNYNIDNNSDNTSNGLLDIVDVKQFLTDMHTEINALTTNAYTTAAATIPDQSSRKQESKEKLSNDYLNTKYNNDNNTTTTTTTSSRSTSKGNSSKEKEVSTTTTNATSTIEKQHLEKTVLNIEQTILIHPGNEDDEEIIEIEPDQVKYHSGETPHPNRVDPFKANQVMSEAEDDDDDEIIEVNPGEVHYHEAVQKQVGLLVPPPALTSSSSSPTGMRIFSKSPSPSRLAIPNIANSCSSRNRKSPSSSSSGMASPRRSNSKSPSPSHLAIISGFIETKRQKEQEDREKTPVNMAEPFHQPIQATAVKESVSGVVVEKNRESAVVNNVEIKSAKVKTLVQNSAALSKNVERDQRNDDGKHLISNKSNVLVNQEEPIIVVNQVEEKNCNSTSTTSHCWSTASEKTTQDLVETTSQKSASSHCNAAASATPSAQGKDANTKNEIKLPFINSNTEKEIYSTTTKMESVEKDVVTESSSSVTTTNLKSIKKEENSFQNLNFEQSINTAHEQTVKNEYFESSTMEIMEDFTSNQEYLVTNTQETKAMEELFDKLVSEENITKTENSVKKSRSFDSIEKWLMASSNHNNNKTMVPVAPMGVLPTVQDHEKSVKLNLNNNKLKEKRFRNKSIDYSSLPNNDHWYNVTATCTTKSYPIPDETSKNADNDNNDNTLKEENNISSKKDSEKNYVEQQLASSSLSADHTENSSETETEVNNSGTMSNKNKPGLCLIIDKLKSIETKLDELKTYDTNAVGFGDTSSHNSSNYDPESPSLLLLPEVIGEAPTLHPGSLDSSNSAEEALLSQPALAEQTSRKSSLTQQNLQENRIKKQEPMIKVNDVVIDSDSEDDTLKDDEVNEVNSATTDVSHTTELLVDDANVVISSPLPTPCPDDDKSKINGLKKLAQLDIMSIHTMSEIEADDEDDDESFSSGRQSRIEELAKKIMEEKSHLAEIERQQQRRDPINLNVELDTVSERSEIEEEDALRQNEKSGRRSADHLTAPQSSQGSFRSRRTRSASRERNLAKIRFCWRCHQTGHESFDCNAELQPANWCPRCLESTHWEDSCWVNEQEIFCNICSLPGHLPCVHQTNDFRQRKLVIETFGWLAFKEWFREPEFWSWWNCSGFTNVPLYKLMQHRPHIASPDLQEISE